MRYHQNVLQIENERRHSSFFVVSQREFKKMLFVNSFDKPQKKKQICMITELNGA